MGGQQSTPIEDREARSRRDQSSTTGIQWPVPPEIADPVPQGSRRAWGKLSYEQRYRRQRRDLLRAAARIASRKGYQGTRISDIVSEAGLSKGTFYEHFASKEECFLDLHRHTNANMLRAGVRAAEANFDRGSYAIVLAVCRALTGFVAQDPGLARALGGELGLANPAIREENAQNRERIAELFVVIARRVGSTLPPDDVPLAAKVLVNGVVSVLPELRRGAPGSGNARNTRRTDAELDRGLRAVARIGCRGLGLEDSEPREPIA